MAAKNLPDILSKTESTRLVELEGVIAENLHGVFRVGRALVEIRNGKLYRVDYATFEDYCRNIWDLGRPRAYQLMDGSEVFDHLSTIVDKQVSPIGDILPTNEAQTRPLAPLPPETQTEVWTLVIETAKGANGRITANLVQQCVNILRQGKVSKAINQAKNSGTTNKVQISEETQVAFQSLMDAIQVEVNGGLKAATRKEMANHLRSLLEEIENG